LLAATRYDGYLRVWNASSGKLLHLLPTSSQPNGLSWSPDGHILALSSDDGTVQFWDTASYQNTRTLNAKEQGEWAFAIPWSPDGRLLACSRDGGSMQVWDTQAGKELQSLSEQTSIWTAAWSPDNQRIASGSDDGTVVFWGIH
jgi:WD40 repeat protein